MEFVQYLTLGERIALLLLLTLFIVAVTVLLARGKFKTKLFEYQGTASRQRHDIFEAETAIDFSTHAAFSRIDTFLNIDIHNFTLSSRFRDTIFKDMIRASWTIKKQRLLELLPALAQAQNVYELKHLMLNCIVECVNDSANRFQAMGIPSIVIEKYSRSVNIYNGILINLVEEITTRPLRKNQMIDLFLVCIVANINTKLIWFKSIFDELNGELKGQEYKGFECRE